MVHIYNISSSMSITSATLHSSSRMGKYFRNNKDILVMPFGAGDTTITAQAVLPSILLLMLGISTLCLHHEPLPQALEKLAAVTGYIEVMDEGLHHLENSEPLLSCSCRFSIHAPCRGTNLASLVGAHLPGQVLS